ncbi:hypothetical protein HYU93_00525 [Candidatus Daviesbacteria bacterium]|nr:hypothetical protein [Candidatus Daviesbacteria bacterium]
MKKTLPVIFAFLLMAFPAGVFAQTATLSLDPASGTFNRGCTFSVKINLDTGATETDGTDAIFMYDSSRFIGQNIANGTIYPDFPGNNIDNASGKITISGLASVSSPFKGTGTLATVNFMVAENAPAGASQITFDFDPQNKAETRDSNVVQRGTVVDVLNSVTNGNYVIGTGSCGQQPAATPTPIPAFNNTGSGSNVVVLPGTGTTVFQGSTGFSTPSAGQGGAKTLDQFVDQTGKGPGTVELTSTLVIFGGILTILGILGIALL